MQSYFNPRPPWGGRLVEAIHAVQTEIFQSTPSVGRATGCAGIGTEAAIFQSTPSVGRATRSERGKFHLPYRFQSTPSVGRATRAVPESRWSESISIHALRGEGDPQEFAKAFGVSAFQSTPSVGRATEAAKAFYKLIIFQSTPSVGRATRLSLALLRICLNFNPRPPWGGRPATERK